MSKRMVAVAALALGAWSAGAAAGPIELPEKLRDAPPNTWEKICDGGFGARTSPGLVWVPGEKAFVLLGGAMDMDPKKNPAAASNPYSEMTLNLKAGRWENRFPEGKLDVWGGRVGPSKAPGFSGSYYRVAMKDVEGNVRPYLGSGYDRAMYLYHNVAWDSDRAVVVVFWHLGGVTTEYDPAKRAWEIVTTAKDLPEGMLDDFVWGAMCYDPVNQEVLAGRGRWAYRTATRTWHRLAFANRVLDPLRARAEKLRLRARDLVGAARSRYYHSETPAEARRKLDALASGIAADAAALARAMTHAEKQAGAPETRQIGWARAELDAARKVLDAAAGLLRGKLAPQAIWRAEDARDLLERCALSLAAAPPPRAWSPMVYDAKNRKIVLFGGDRMDRRLADTWVYDCAARTWQLRRPRLSPSPRAGHGLAYLPRAGRVLLVDGYATGPAGQMWVYDVAANEWALLAEGAQKRPRLTGRGSHSFLPGPLAAAPGDLVVTTSHRERTGRSTWAARIDATKTDPDRTKKLGVGFLAMSTPTGPTNPRYYEKTGPPPDPAEGEELKALPPNRWVARKPPSNPRVNRAWGTTVLDPLRDQLIQWGGGHAAYCGTDVLHYSIRTNRCSTGSYLPDFALNWNGSMLGPPITRTFTGRPHTAHGYHHYGFDAGLGRVVGFSQKSGGWWYVYDPWTRDWQGTVGERIGRKHSGAHNYTCVPHPEGLLVWASGKLNLLWQFDAEAKAWRTLPVKGKLPAMRVDCHGMACDSKRQRLLFFSQFLKGDVVAYDLKTRRAAPLAAAGGEAPHVFLREVLYVPHADVVLAGTRQAGGGGRFYWSYYDCARNAWAGVHLPGADPIGPRATARHNVGLGLCYDAKRELIWAVGARADISALRLDLKSADVKPLGTEKP